jgi:hypothetical protein
MEFDYGASRDIDSIRRDYEKVLGTPDKISSGTIDGLPVRATVWQDAATEFRLIEFAGARHKGVAATAVLSDRRTPGRKARN